MLLWLARGMDRAVANVLECLGARLLRLELCCHLGKHVGLELLADGGARALLRRDRVEHRVWVHGLGLRTADGLWVWAAA